MQLAGFFLSHYIEVFFFFLVVFSFTLSVTHAIAVVFPGNSTVAQIFPPKICQGTNASEISHLELLSTIPNPENFSGSIEIVRYI